MTVGGEGARAGKGVIAGDLLSRVVLWEETHARPAFAAAGGDGVVAQGGAGGSGRGGRAGLTVAWTVVPLLG